MPCVKHEIVIQVVGRGRLEMGNGVLVVVVDNLFVEEAREDER